MRRTEQGCELCLLVDDENGRRMFYVISVVGLRSRMKDAQRFCQDIERVKVAADAVHAIAEGVDVFRESLGVIAGRIDAHENNLRDDLGACVFKATANDRQLLQRNRTDVRALREAEEDEADLTGELAPGERFAVVARQGKVGQWQRRGQDRRNLGAGGFQARKHKGDAGGSEQADHGREK